MPGRDIIVIGASAGGVQALTELIRGLPDDLPAAVFIVVHTSPTSPGILPQILDRAGPLPVTHAVDGEEIRHSQVYVAPPDHHMLVKHGTIRVVKGPKENGFRPAADPLFRTAARVAGPRTVGIVLSGGLDDGTEGLALIKKYGGIAVVQDPAEAHFPSMPASAIAHVDVDHVLPVAQMPPLLTRLAREPLPEGVLAMSGRDKNGNELEGPDVAEVGDASLATGDLPGSPSGFTCPDCGGALWELQSGKLFKYRCHVGHAYTSEALVAEQTRALEVALWTGLRALEEYAALRRRMARRAKTENWKSVGLDYERQADEAEERAALIRNVLIDDEVPSPGGKGERKGGSLPRPKWDGRLYNRGAKGQKGNGARGSAGAAGKEKPTKANGSGERGAAKSSRQSARPGGKPAGGAEKRKGRP